jgi:hypothetical protein
METELREKIVVDGAEAAASKLGALAQAATRVMHSFHGLVEIASAVGGIAGLFKVVETVHEVDHLFQAVMRVKDMTGIAAEHAHAMFDMFELSGVPMESAERIITSMTRKGAQLEDSFGGVGGQAQRLNHLMKALGITIKSGPEDRLFAMAKAAQAGKLDIAQLIQGFGIPRGQAAAMMSMLKQGPDKLRAIQKDTLAGADVIDDRTIESYRKMLQIRRELGDAWGDLVGVLYKNLLPAITVVLKQLKQGFDDIAPIAAAIGKGLSDHMRLVVAATKTYVALLLASKIANIGAETPMGVVGRGKQLYGGAMKLMGGRAAKAGAMDYFEARAASPATGMFGTAGGPLVRIMGSVAGRLGIIGAVIGVVIVAFEMLKRNTLGIRDAFVKTFASIFSAVGSVIGKVVAVLGKLWEAIRPLVALISGTLLFGLLLLAKVIGFVADVLDLIMTGVVALVNALLWVVNKIPGINIDYIDMDAAKDKAADSAADAKPGTGDGKNTNYQDFRGSKFEINNNFPPGIDGGRVAVAFGDELARLGERRLDSGVRPLFSYR